MDYDPEDADTDTRTYNPGWAFGDPYIPDVQYSYPRLWREHDCFTRELSHTDQLWQKWEARYLGRLRYTCAECEPAAAKRCLQAPSSHCSCQSLSRWLCRFCEQKEALIDKAYTKRRKTCGYLSLLKVDGETIERPWVPGDDSDDRVITIKGNAVSYVGWHLLFPYSVLSPLPPHAYLFGIVYSILSLFCACYISPLPFLTIA